MAGELFKTEFDGNWELVGARLKLREHYAIPITPEQQEVMSMQAYLAEESSNRFQKLIKAVLAQVTKREFRMDDLQRVRMVDTEDISGKRVINYYFDEVLLGTIQSDIHHGTESIFGTITFVPSPNLDSGEEITL